MREKVRQIDRERQTEREKERGREKKKERKRMKIIYLGNVSSSKKPSLDIACSEPGKSGM